MKGELHSNRKGEWKNENNKYAMQQNWLLQDFDISGKEKQGVSEGIVISIDKN